MANWVNLCIEWFSLPGLALLAGILLKRRQYHEFPLFFWYVIVTELVGLTRLAASHAPVYVYSRAYWVSDIVLVFFAFLATYELFIKRLFSGFYKVRFFRYLFPAAGILFNIVVVCVALYGNHARVLLLTARMYEFLRAAVLFFFVALMIAMGRQWQMKEFGIAFGLGLDVSTSLAIVAFFAHYTSRSPLLNSLLVVPYDIACLVWIYCFWTAKETTTAPPISPDALQEARKWEGSLKDFVSPGKR